LSERPPWRLKEIVPLRREGAGGVMHVTRTAADRVGARSPRVRRGVRRGHGGVPRVIAAANRGSVEKRHGGVALLDDRRK
jgi:hypothetical protein